MVRSHFCSQAVHNRRQCQPPCSMESSYYRWLIANFQTELCLKTIGLEYLRLLIVTRDFLSHSRDGQSRNGFCHCQQEGA